ncbi:hypothetical protein NBH15_28630 [Parabacteroides sp. W1-Q-101]|uniref:hypothetical protein n=1 Tax=Parabacteroides caeci TaxID=2949650 RepID=UPI0020306C17|nr:hypothetical protein [Parabacteroides sp. W1-Q-101]MCM0722217.1 hypothetical protein [Parabacteroides sp. W1-Q-101]
MEVNIIKTEGKPLEKLIETVSSAIGTLYKPTQIRKEAKANAEALIIQKEAEAKGMIIIADADAGRPHQNSSKKFIIAK